MEINTFKNIMYEVDNSHHQLTYSYVLSHFSLLL